MVMETARLIAGAEGISGREMDILLLGAASHDCGFLVTVTEHEEAGCRWIEPRLVEWDFSGQDIETIKGLIMATRLPQSPNTHLEEILCDADLAYVGTENYTVISTRLLNEMIALGRSLTQEEWLDIQISFLERHTFFTSFARSTWDEGKAAVIRDLRRQREGLQ
jgi:uncharacterized protein